MKRLEDKRLRIMWLAFANIKAYLPEFAILLVSFPIYLAVMFFLWKAVLANSAAPAMNFSVLITYYAVAYVLNFCLTQRWSVSEQASEAVRNGYMAIYLTRPLDFRTFLFFNSVGTTLFFFAPVLTALMLVAGFFIHFAFAVSLLPLLLFFVLVAMSFVFNFFFFLLFGALAFWAEDTRMILYGVDTCISFFGGMWIPLAFLPAWLQTAAALLPFKYAFALPTMILLGQATLADAACGIAILAAWTAVFYLISKFVWERGLKRFTGYGI